MRDAYYETEAVIDHLVYHKNTPPFISKNLIQHFGISNPSPRYISEVSTAFKTGRYTVSGITQPFGEGKWGDLAATAAAILLDREATAAVLDADPVHGSVKEPFNKLIALMRAMLFTRTSYSKMRYPILKSDLRTAIGQMPYEAPDVFSFFSPIFKPAGFFSNTGLASPEAQVLSMVTIVGTANGMNELVKQGTLRCRDGFGDHILDNWYNNPFGKLEFASNQPSSAEIIDELDLEDASRYY